MHCCFSLYRKKWSFVIAKINNKATKYKYTCIIASLYLQLYEIGKNVNCIQYFKRFQSG